MLHDLLRRFVVLAPVAMALFWLGIAIVHVAFAAAVLRHSVALRTSGRHLAFVGPELWGLATLLSGVLGATAYWLLHCSTIALPEAASVPAPAPEARPSTLPQA